MQWKIPFLQYFESDRSRIHKIAEQFNADPVLEVSLTTTNLSEPQINVIKMFPTPMDAMDQNWIKMTNLVDAWKDQKEIWPMSQTCKLVGGANALSSAFLINRFRRAFNLADGRTAVLNSYVPGMLLPVFFGAIFHYQFITGPIVAGYDQCLTCKCINAGLIQAAISTIYPLIHGSVTSIYFADYFTTYPTPESLTDSTSRKYVYDILLQSVKRNKTPLILVPIINFVFAYYMTLKERECIEFMYFSLLQKEVNKLNNKR